MKYLAACTKNQLYNDLYRLSIKCKLLHLVRHNKHLTRENERGGGERCFEIESLLTIKVTLSAAE